MSYNGWTNWDTWNVYNWLSSDERAYKAVCSYGKDELEPLEYFAKGFIPEDEEIDFDKVDWEEIQEALKEE